MGIVIFLTTLVVTVIHLTLATTLYLYLGKLRRTASQKIFYPNFMPNSRLNSLTPSSSSSISSLGRAEDTLSLGEEPIAYTSAVPIASHVKSSTAEVPPNPLALNHLAARLKEEQGGPRHAKWFGMTSEHQFGSIRSAFNRENVFFGPKEQRFLGINNYAFSPAGDK